MQDTAVEDFTQTGYSHKIIWHSHTLDKNKFLKPHA